jgi:hypothetical protein
MDISQYFLTVSMIVAAQIPLSHLHAEPVSAGRTAVERTLKAVTVASVQQQGAAESVRADGV